MAAIEEGRRAGEELGREGCEGEVPAGEDDGCGVLAGFWRVVVSGDCVRYPEFC